MDTNHANDPPAKEASGLDQKPTQSEHTMHIEETSWELEDHGDNSAGNADWSKKQMAAYASLCMLWVGSQVPLYFVGGSLAYMVKDLGGAQAQAWLPVCYTLVLAGICPFVGYLQDLLGRRYMTLGGAVVILVGSAVVGSAHSFGQGIAGMCIAGGGAAVGELTALAGTSELVPVRKRGLYIGIIILFLLPFCPYVMYSQLLSTHATWRWTMWISMIYNAIALVGITLFYFPERIHSTNAGPGLAILTQIDYVGGFLSIVGAVLFLVAIQAGGYTYPWSSARVLAPLIIGVLLVGIFFVWECKVAKHPLIPRELFQGHRAVAISFLAAFVGGMNFYSLLNFFPLSFETLFDPAPVQVGLKGLGYGFSVTLGAVFFNILLTVFKNHHREVMIIAAVVMTAFGGALAAVTPETPRLAVALGTICGFGTGGLLVPPQTIAISCR
ncbi:hypothetical protein CLAIMM_06732 isoform 1 [Cladophialophora immunda]|nr:hypothetical protein CLAIMM_06732 isoform 1 [Cladophialophora immunda]